MAKVYLVGAGPGAPDLLTLRAARVLQEADIVYYDALVHPDTLALAQRAKKIAVGKRCGRHSTAQKFINKRLVDAARKYERVVRLKGGDPMLFGRAQEEMDALEAAGIEYEVVPGITAALAASAEIGVSLTRRGLSRNLTFVTPRVGEMERESDWAAAALHADTAAIYMGAGEAARIAETLIARGRAADTPVALVESASLPEAAVRYGVLSELPALAASCGNGPALILLGEVLREKLALAQRGDSRAVRCA
ncbi:MAG: uroporphyrinogen-III C-methyltransferase [Burkholderiales bacterium]|nr:uroporphyrinogen-III C-methyltransferase [Burkholderiales bacterium]